MIDMKKLALILALLLPSLASAQQTQSSVQTQINANITTNGQDKITGAKLNSVLTTINQAIFQPAVNLVCSIAPTTCVSIFGYASPVWWGADPLGASDSAAAFNSALGASNNVKFPPGVFKLNSQITYTFPAINGKFAALAIEGSADGVTQLLWPNATNGIVINITYNAFQSVQISNLSLVTDQANGGNALTVLGIAAPVITPTSIIRNVTIRGSKYIANGPRYWTEGIDWDTVGALNVSNISIFGSTGSPTSAGTGMRMHGTSGFSSGPVQIINSYFWYLQTSIDLEAYNQAIQVTNCNFFSYQNSSIGISIPASLGTATTGQITVSASQFGSMDYGIRVQSGPGNVQLIGNLFLSNRVASVSLDEYYNVSMNGNIFQGNGIGLGIGVPQGTYIANVNGNFFIGNTTALDLENAASTVGANGNTFVSNSTNIANSSTVATNVIVSNPGYNPVGIVSDTTYAPASNATYQAGPSPETHYLTGGTVTAVEIAAHGQQTVWTSTPCIIQLPPNGTFSVTYSSPPLDLVWVQ